MLSLVEILNLIVATLVVGYIFTGIIKFRKPNELSSHKRFDWQEFKFAVLVSAPGVILHELAHKFVAIFLGLNAVFSVWPLGLGIGVILKLLGTGFLFLAPGYVSISASSPFQMSLTAFAGPFINLLLFVTGFLVSKYSKNLYRISALFWLYTKEINKWLFVFNMIPIPPLDGHKVFSFLF